MNGFIVIAIIVLAVFALLAIIGGARRRDTNSAIGELSGETIKRDRTARKAHSSASEESLTGREVEQAAVLARTGGAEIESAGTSAPATWVPPDADAFGVTRRQFLNRSVIGLFVVGLSTFGVAIVGFLWPTGSSGFGSKIRMGKISELLADIRANDGFLYKPEARAWITSYPASALPKAEQTYSPPELTGMKVGLVALYQKCPHLGCRVPSCASSQWFECPCHGSKYNQVGEKKAGPAPRGMDRFAMEVSGDEFIVNTGMVIQGPPIGTNTTGQEAEGAHCIGAAGGH